MSSNKFISAIKSKLITISVLLFACQTCSAKNLDVWSCHVSSATGFAYSKESKKWRAADFAINNDVYTVKACSSADCNVRYLVQGSGKDSARETFYCKDGIDEAGFLDCTDLLGDGSFRLNTYSLRFLVDSPYGYYVVGGPPIDLRGLVQKYAKARMAKRSVDSNSDSPIMKIGYCDAK